MKSMSRLWLDADVHLRNDGKGMVVKFPRVIAAQRLQTWLLVMALVALVVTGLLVVDLANNLRTVVIGEANRALQNSVKELLQAAESGERKWGSGSPEVADQALKPLSYEVLRSYPDVEGGYLWDDNVVVGHSFPTYTEPGSTLRQPPFERQEVLSALSESRRTGRVGTQIAQDGKDMVLVAVWADSRHRVAAWSLRRIFNFSDSSELNKRTLLVGVMLFALLAVGIVLRLSFRLQRGFAMVQAGLEHLRTEPGFRLPDQERELKPVVDAINTMAESRQHLEAELRREDRLRVMGRVVAGIAHEIRNPLNSIRLTIRVLTRRLQGQEQAAEPVRLVISEIDRLDALLKSLLAFRPDEPATLRLQPLAPIIGRTLALVTPHARECGVAIRVDGKPDASGLVDADFLQQSLINLLLNAVDASQSRGDVRVNVQQAAGAVSIDVEDSGPGLLPEQMDRIFEAFYTTKPGGTGLGLAVTKTLLDKMGASIKCSNSGRGARFQILVPQGNPA